MNYFTSLKWPILIFFSWISDWLLFFTLNNLNFSVFFVFLFIGCKVVIIKKEWWKKVILSIGFPLSLIFTGFDSTPLFWICGFSILIFIYPPNLWSNAPIYPTRENTLFGVSNLLPQKIFKILDVGSGLGHGLSEITREFPNSQVFGIERSPLLWLVSKLKSQKTNLFLGDMWTFNWNDFDIIYVFQRPEIMGKILEKAKQDLKPGSYLISLEFEIPDIKPFKKISTNNNNNVFIYQI